MPHADSSLIPSDITTKSEFYNHVLSQLEALLEGSRYWISNLAQASSLLYHAYLSSPLYGSTSHHDPVVNWVGFYIHPPSSSSGPRDTPLLLGPYNGRPACLSISVSPARGVCGNSFNQNQALVVPDVEAYPGHIACDGSTRSEIVIPLYMSDWARPVGVLDLDSTLLSTFDEQDRIGLENIVGLLSQACDWA